MTPEERIAQLESNQEILKQKIENLVNSIIETYRQVEEIDTKMDNMKEEVQSNKNDQDDLEKQVEKGLENLNDDLRNLQDDLRNAMNRLDNLESKPHL